LTRRTRIGLGAACLAAFALVAPASASAVCDGLPPTVAGATAGNDTLTGTAGNDVIEGLGGNDTLSGLGGNDTICGDDGDDTVDGGIGQDTMLGGADGDTVSFASLPTSGSPTVVGLFANLATGSATTQYLGAMPPDEIDTLTGFENLTGSDSFDFLTGNIANNVIRGLIAPDVFEGLGGDDTLIDDVGGLSDQDGARYTTAGPGGVTGNLATGTVTGDGVGTDTLTGFRTLVGSNFADVLIGNSENQPSTTTDNELVGGGGDDILEPLRGSDVVDGGGGADLVTYANDIAIDIDLSTGQAVTTLADEVDSITQVENVTGSPNNDTITGNGNANVLNGLGGADALNGGSGGVDTATFAGLAQSVDANLVTGTAIAIGAGDTDTLANFDNMTGTHQDDFLTGDENGNVLNGGTGGVDSVRFSGVLQGVDASLLTNTATGQGSDTLAGIENLSGSDEDDTLTGDDGPNALSGRDGADNLTGGLGADGLFLGAGADQITANDGVVDVIDCEGGGPDSGLVDGPAPAENYITDCDSDGDAVLDFLDACPTIVGTSCPPSSNPTPPPAAATPAAPAKTKKCKKGFVKKKVKGKKKCVKKKKRK
jgi:Ca2+-binding RTX toxin-like protein